MSEDIQDTQPGLRVVWYAPHGAHLHAYHSEEEARAFAAEFTDGTYYPSNEVIQAMRQRKGQIEITLAATDLLAAQSPLEQSLAYTELKRAILTFGAQIADDLETGALDKLIEPGKLTHLKAAQEEMDLLLKVDQNIDRRIRIVASRPKDGQRSVTDLLGREFEILAYNPVTDEVQIEPPAGTPLAGGPITLNADEYVFVDDTGVAPTTDKLRD